MNGTERKDKWRPIVITVRARGGGHQRLMPLRRTGHFFGSRGSQMKAHQEANVACLLDLVLIPLLHCL